MNIGFILDSCNYKERCIVQVPMTCSVDCEVVKLRGWVSQEIHLHTFAPNRLCTSLFIIPGGLLTLLSLVIVLLMKHVLFCMQDSE